MKSNEPGQPSARWEAKVRRLSDQILRTPRSEAGTNLECADFPSSRLLHLDVMRLHRLTLAFVWHESGWRWPPTNFQLLGESQEHCPGNSFANYSSQELI